MWVKCIKLKEIAGAQVHISTCAKCDTPCQQKNKLLQLIFSKKGNKEDLQLKINPKYAARLKSSEHLCPKNLGKSCNGHTKYCPDNYRCPFRWKPNFQTIQYQYIGPRYIGKQNDGTLVELTDIMLVTSDIEKIYKVSYQLAITHELLPQTDIEELKSEYARTFKETQFMGITEDLSEVISVKQWYAQEELRQNPLFIVEGIYELQKGLRKTNINIKGE